MHHGLAAFKDRPIALARVQEDADDMDNTQAELAKHGIEFSSLEEFRGNRVVFVGRKDACGISLEFIQGPERETLSET